MDRCDGGVLFVARRYYLGNAKILRGAAEDMGLKCHGGDDSPCVFFCRGCCCWSLLYATTFVVAMCVVVCEVVCGVVVVDRGRRRLTRPTAKRPVSETTRHQQQERECLGRRRAPQPHRTAAPGSPRGDRLVGVSRFGFVTTAGARWWPRRARRGALAAARPVRLWAGN